MKKKITDNGAAIFATYYTDENPSNGRRPDPAGQGCIFHEHNRGTISGTFTPAELTKRCPGIPVINIFDCLCVHLFAAMDLPIKERAAYLLKHGAYPVNPA